MNAFNSANYPDFIPQELIAGDRWAWKRGDLSEYGVGYSLTYELTLDTGVAPITLSSTLSDGVYLVEIAAATTAGYTAGDYQWVELITRDSDSERIRLNYGTLTVEPDPATSAADTRSHAKTVLDAIEAVIEGRANKDQESYSIAGRSLSRTPIIDLLMMRQTYKKEVSREEQAERIRQGINTGSQIVVRMR